MHIMYTRKGKWRAKKKKIKEKSREEMLKYVCNAGIERFYQRFHRYKIYMC